MNPDENNQLFTGNAQPNQFATLGLQGVPTSTEPVQSTARDATRGGTTSQGAGTQNQSSNFSKLQDQVNLAQQVRAAQNRKQNDFLSTEAPEEVPVDALGDNESIDDLQSRLDATEARVENLAQPTQQELELANTIQREDLQAQQAQRNLFGQGMGTPLSLLQGEQRKMQEQRSFQRAFDMLELDLLESSRERQRKVAQGELDAAQAEAEQVQEIRDANDALIERMASTFQGTDLNELQQTSPETYSSLINAVANSTYTLGELEQALKPEQQNLTIRNVGGRVVGINPQTGQVEQDYGASGTGGSSGGGAAPSSIPGVSLNQLLEGVPDMSNESASTYANQLRNEGYTDNEIEKIVLNAPKAFSENRVRRMSEEELNKFVQARVNKIKEDSGLWSSVFGISDENKSAAINKIMQSIEGSNVLKAPIKGTNDMVAYALTPQQTQQIRQQLQSEL